MRTHIPPIPAAAALLLLLAAADAAGSDVRNTRHNLSVSGPGTVKALSETRVCVFCHTPHNGSPAAQLWNRNQPAGPYVQYTSSTLDAAPALPDDRSKLCLSCHDGTIALGAVLSEPT